MMLLVKYCLVTIVLMIVPIVSVGETRVAVASNFLATLKLLAPLYEKQSGEKLIISSGSSGKLYAQIINGAPYDVFLSADKFYPEELVVNGIGVDQSRFVYAKGVMVLWSRENRLIDPKKLESCDIQYVAIANTNTAPYGVAAIQAMRKLNVFDAVKNKIVRGESVGQAFQFVASGNAQVGFVALSQVLNPNNNFNREYWQIPMDFYSPLEQQAILIKDTRRNRQFINFLRSNEAQKIIKASGYL